jgi:hypothetical protein
MCDPINPAPPVTKYVVTKETPRLVGQAFEPDRNASISRAAPASQPGKADLRKKHVGKL